MGQFRMAESVMRKQGVDEVTQTEEGSENAGAKLFGLRRSDQAARAAGSSPEIAVTLADLRNRVLCLIGLTGFGDRAGDNIRGQPVSIVLTKRYSSVKTSQLS